MKIFSFLKKILIFKRHKPFEIGEVSEYSGLAGVFIDVLHLKYIIHSMFGK